MRTRLCQLDDGRCGRVIACIAIVDRQGRWNRKSPDSSEQQKLSGSDEVSDALVAQALLGKEFFSGADVRLLVLSSPPRELVMACFFKSLR